MKWNFRFPNRYSRQPQRGSPSPESSFQDLDLGFLESCVNFINARCMQDKYTPNWKKQQVFFRIMIAVILIFGVAIYITKKDSIQAPKLELNSPPPAQQFAPEPAHDSKDAPSPTSGAAAQENLQAPSETGQEPPTKGSSPDKSNATETNTD